MTQQPPSDPDGLPQAPAYNVPAPQCQACGAPLPADGICRNCHQVAGLPPGVRVVEPGRRFLAYLLDIALAVVTLVIGYLIWTLILWKDGRTPAKRIMKLRVVDLDTRRPASWGRMALREFIGLGILVSLTAYIWFVVSVIMLLVRDDRRAGWDLLANTVEVDERSHPF
jgi:uncharacterized RDD family membrane protein YckC